MNLPVFGNEYECDGLSVAAVETEPVDGKEFGK
jgi:hypothetical protein